MPTVQWQIQLVLSCKRWHQNVGIVKSCINSFSESQLFFWKQHWLYSKNTSLVMFDFKQTWKCFTSINDCTFMIQSCSDDLHYLYFLLIVSFSAVTIHRFYFHQQFWLNANKQIHSLPMMMLLNYTRSSQISWLTHNPFNLIEFWTCPTTREPPPPPRPPLHHASPALEVSVLVAAGVSKGRCAATARPLPSVAHQH